MKLEQRAVDGGVTMAFKNEPAVPAWTQDPLLRKLVLSLPNPSTGVVARAPGRLDLMGGFAEYTGSSVVQTPTRDAAFVALQPRTDAHLALLPPSTSVGAEPCCFPVNEVTAMVDHPAPAEGLRNRLGEDPSGVCPCVVGTITEAMRAGLIPGLGKGFSIAAAELANGRGDLAQHAALSAAVLVALTAAADVPLDARTAAEVCQAVENNWLGAPVGVAGAVCALNGEAGTLGEVSCDPCSIGRSIPVPDGVEFVGVDCGVFHDEAMKRYAQARTAAFMGRTIVDRIIAHEGAGRVRWDGYLSRLSMNDYVERFRDRIPVKLKGRDFLDHFGETGDPLTCVDPAAIYKIRSRTEHHIYENARSRQFVPAMNRLHDGDRSALTEVSELMFASHWSYGQRCGLGSIETDLLVGLVRRLGEGLGIHGAKITGRGCGGVVVVLMDSTDQAWSALEKATKEYSAQTHHSTSYIRGSTPGAMLTGAHRF